MDHFSYRRVMVYLPCPKVERNVGFHTTHEVSDAQKKNVGLKSWPALHDYVVKIAKRNPTMEPKTVFA